VSLAARVGRLKRSKEKGLKRALKKYSVSVCRPVRLSRVRKTCAPYAHAPAEGAARVSMAAYGTSFALLHFKLDC